MNPLRYQLEMEDEESVGSDRVLVSLTTRRLTRESRLRVLPARWLRRRFPPHPNPSSRVRPQGAYWVALPHTHLGTGKIIFNDLPPEALTQYTMFSPAGKGLREPILRTDCHGDLVVLRSRRQPL